MCSLACKFSQTLILKYFKVSSSVVCLLFEILSLSFVHPSNAQDDQRVIDDLRGIVIFSKQPWDVEVFPGRQVLPLDDGNILRQAKILPPEQNFLDRYPSYSGEIWYSRTIVLNELNMVHLTGGPHWAKKEYDLHGAIERLEELQHLESLDMRYCDVDDHTLQIVNKIGLMQLKLGATGISDMQLNQLNDAQQLVALDLTDNQITNEGIKQLKCLPNLRVIRFAGTRVNDNLTDFWASAIRLEVVSAHNTNVGDQFVEVITSLPNVKELDLSNTKISGHAIARILAMPNLECVYLNDCRFGDIPLRDFLVSKSIKHVGLQNTTFEKSDSVLELKRLLTDAVLKF